MPGRAGLAVAALLALTACGSTDSSTTSSTPTASTTPSPTTNTSTPPTTSTTTSATTSATSSATSSATASATSSSSTVGSSDHAAPVQVGRDLLRWSNVPGPTSAKVTVGDRWTLTVPQDGSRATLTGPKTISDMAGPHQRISRAVMDDDHALVVTEDDTARRPDSATVIDLAHGTRTFHIDGQSHPATSVGGSWALGATSLVHAAYDARHRYCLASVDLDSEAGQIDLCVPPRHGLSRASLTAAGETLMTFDDQQPSCRTLVNVIQLKPTPIPGVTKCVGWDSLATPDGDVWSVVPNANRIDAAHFFARSGDTTYDLGPGTSGTLVSCGDAAYFVRDPHSSTDHADLLRWRGGHLDVVFESKGTGKAFLSAPRCAGNHLTINAYAAAGDQQVTATVG